MPFSSKGRTLLFHSKNKGSSPLKGRGFIIMFPQKKHFEFLSFKKTKIKVNRIFFEKFIILNFTILL